MLSAALTILLYFAAPATACMASQETLDVVPVGVRYDLDPDPARRRTDLENMRRLRFTVIAPGPSAPGRHGPSRASIACSPAHGTRP